MTAGQEVLKVDHEIIQRQMADTFGDRIRGSDDKSQMMEAQRDFFDGKGRQSTLRIEDKQKVAVNWNR